MELDELLDREGLDPDELMTWARARAGQLLAELSNASDELARLLEPAAQIDIENIPVRRVAVVDDMLPVSVGPAPVQADLPVEEEVEESITEPIVIAAPVDEPPVEADAAEVGGRGRRRVPSTPQPLSASELPPPPEHPRLADGEPEPMLETVDTGPIDLGTAEARAMIAAHSTLAPPMAEPEASAEFEIAVEPEAAAEFEIAFESEAAVESEAAPEAEAASEAEPEAAEPVQLAAAPSDEDAPAADATEEFEIDELEEIDDEELELLVEVDDSDDEDSSEPAPPPPPRPPPSKPSARTSAAPAPAKPDNTVDIDDLIAGLADSDS